MRFYEAEKLYIEMCISIHIYYNNLILYLILYYIFPTCIFWSANDGKSAKIVI